MNFVSIPTEIKLTYVGRERTNQSMLENFLQEY